MLHTWEPTIQIKGDIKSFTINNEDQKTRNNMIKVLKEKKKKNRFLTIRTNKHKNEKGEIQNKLCGTELETADTNKNSSFSKYINIDVKYKLTLQTWLLNTILH